MNDLLERLRKRTQAANPLWYQTIAIGANHPQAYPQTVQRVVTQFDCKVCGIPYCPTAKLADGEA